MQKKQNKKAEAVNLLIVDDHSLLRESLKRLLESYKKTFILNVKEASSGEDAIKKIKDNDFEIILMDYRMSGINGAEATRRILKIKPKMKILGFSNIDASPIVEDMLNAGAKGYLLKDLDGNELLHAIKTVLSGKRYYSHQIAEKLQNYNAV